MFLSCHVCVSEWIHKLLAWNRRDIWSLNDCNGTRTHSHLVCQRTLNHLAKLAKWLSRIVSTYLYGAFDYIFMRWMFVYKLSCCGFDFRCSHLNLRYCTCFEQGVPWHLGNNRVWIHSETRTWDDKNIQSNASYR